MMKSIKVSVKIEEVDHEARGWFTYKNERYSVPNVLVNEEVLVEITWFDQRHATKVLKRFKDNKDRIKARCPVYEECGGCHLQHVSAKYQNNFKWRSVRGALGEYGKLEKLIAMKTPYSYRHKAHASFKVTNRGKLISGPYAEGSHRVVDTNRCLIHHPKADAIILTVKNLAKKYNLEIYDDKEHKGSLRHVLVRIGKITGEIMVVIVTGKPTMPAKEGFVNDLLRYHPEITTIIHNHNQGKTSMVLGKNEKVLFGEGYIHDEIDGMTFRISSKAFYQVNPEQMFKLYKKAIEYAALTGKETVLDAYCGTGTIGLLASRHASEVIGVELNQTAVKDAEANAKANKVKNAFFVHGDAGTYMLKQEQSFDVLFMDPPRNGADEKFINAVIESKPKRIVYISCNPQTQARDVEMLTKGGYSVDNIQPVDLFPQTYHVEAIVSLSL